MSSGSPANPDWDIKPERVYMHPLVYRDIVLADLHAKGWPRAAAKVEADRRLEVMRSASRPAGGSEATRP